MLSLAEGGVENDIMIETLIINVHLAFEDKKALLFIYKHY